MALYCGGKARKIYLNGKLYRLNAFGQVIETVDGKLLDVNRYILKDANGMYLLAKENEIIITNLLMGSTDGYVFSDNTGKQFVFKEE